LGSERTSLPSVFGSWRLAYHVLIPDTISLAMVKNSDIYVLSGLLAHDGAWSYRSLAERLGVPHPVVQRALERAKGADLYSGDRREVHLPHFEEFALHALRFVAPARLGALTPGVPAAWAAEPMAGAIRSSGDEPGGRPSSRCTRLRLRRGRIGRSSVKFSPCSTASGPEMLGSGRPLETFSRRRCGSDPWPQAGECASVGDCGDASRAAAR